MKKLLALILCVMMFVSVMSTAAFAADRIDTTDQRVWAGASQQKKIVDALRNNVEAMYGSYAVDNAVFNSVKSIDSILTGLVDEMLKNYSSNNIAPGLGTDTTSSDLNDAIVAGLRSTVGGSISDYLNKHQNDYYKYDSAGHKVFDPAAYAGVYAKAASNALTSEKAVAGIQAFMIYAASRSAFNELAMQAQDLRNDINSWEHWADYGFGDSLDGNDFIRWHVANDTDPNIDHVLNGVIGNYNTALSELGQLGVDLNRDGRFNLGFQGWVETVDGEYVRSTADKNERVNSALIDYLYSPNNDEGTALLNTGWIYEGNTGTYHVDTDGDDKVDSIAEPDDFGPSAYFIWSGEDERPLPVDHAAEGAAEADLWMRDPS